MKQLLEYREGGQEDSDPLRIERTPGRVRIVARYPRKQRIRARNRFLFAATVSIGWMLAVFRMMTLYPRGFWGVLGSLWMLGVIITLIMARQWRRSAWIFVFTVTERELTIEEKGLLWGWTKPFAREDIVEVSIERDRRGRAESLRIRMKHAGAPSVWLEGFDGKDLAGVADALRDALGMQPCAAP